MVVHDFTPDAVQSGSIMSHGGAAVPTGWLLCDGASYLRSSQASLFAAIGTTFGSADGTHFNVPDLRGKSPLGANGSHSLGSTGGTETETLSTAQLPSHSHGVGSYVAANESSHTHGIGTYAAAPESSHTHGVGTLAFAGTASNTGAGSAHAHGIGSLYTGGLLRGDLSTGGSAGAHQNAFGSSNVGALNGTMDNEASHTHPYTPTGTISGSSGSGSSHTHTMSGTSGSGSAHTHTLSGTSGTSGSGSSHNNLHPYQAVNFIIKV